MKIFDVLLVLHVTGGGASLLIGSFILSLRKGDSKHKLLGKIYFISMLTSALVALPMAFMHANNFLLIVGVFTSYMLLSGKRCLKIRTQTQIKTTDWLLTVTMLIFGLAFIFLGSQRIIAGNYFGIVFLVFGLISLIFVRQDYQNFNNHSKFKNFWLTTHIQRMMGSYIASVTAFLVVNITFVNDIIGIILWLIPTAALTPFILKWLKKYGLLKERI